MAENSHTREQMLWTELVAHYALDRKGIIIELAARKESFLPNALHDNGFQGIALLVNPDEEELRLATQNYNAQRGISVIPVPGSIPRARHFLPNECYAIFSTKPIDELLRENYLSQDFPLKQEEELDALELEFEKLFAKSKPDLVMMTRYAIGSPNSWRTALSEKLARRYACTNNDLGQSKAYHAAQELILRHDDDPSRFLILEVPYFAIKDLSLRKQ